MTELRLTPWMQVAQDIYPGQGFEAQIDLYHALATDIVTERSMAVGEQPKRDGEQIAHLWKDEIVASLTGQLAFKLASSTHRADTDLFGNDGLYGLAREWKVIHRWHHLRDRFVQIAEAQYDDDEVPQRVSEARDILTHIGERSLTDRQIADIITNELRLDIDNILVTKEG